MTDDELDRDPVYRAWCAALSAAYSRGRPDLVDTPFPDFVLRAVYRQNGGDVE